ncbi:arsenate reductase ArsC [Pararobbsia silviterrae]|uniref:Arsenate reductase ArsC n=1 Tax=Pararobbsia silviterrae TaxID=1792498 RepID=A0A494YAC1_9BURK|nr:arsenate reductase ArsC [Pararobbsia silviterrae]RKP58690.1 arsenate reductase ArsC [Pararobbsia silviterrae]
MKDKCNVLFLCWANSARSIMAESLLRELGGKKFGAFSAGVEPAARAHPLALAQLEPHVTSEQPVHPKSWRRFADADAEPMDIIIAMCAQSGALSPTLFPGTPIFCRWNFPDPVEAQGSTAEQARAFEKVFRQILRRISVFVALPLHSMKRADTITTIDNLRETDPSASFKVDDDA